MTTPRWTPLSADTGDRAAFPTLSDAQLARVAAHGVRQPIQPGQVLIDTGERSAPFFVVVRGAIDVVQIVDASENVVVTHRAGQFSGEGNMIAGRPSLLQVRARETGEVIRLEREQLFSLIQNDAELSEILMRAFLHRRAELVAGKAADVIVLGSSHSAATLRVMEFLTRNNHPYRSIDLEKDSDAQELLERFQVGLQDVPVLLCSGHALRNPTNHQIAECLGLNAAIDPGLVRDVVIVGAGPSGLSAAVYAGSEGLNALVLEQDVPGGQAGTSSRIENYLGFPTGISGLELTSRAYAQAEKFGTPVMIASGALKLRCDRQPYVIEVDNQTQIAARTIVIATGARYRRLALENLERFEGNGVYYAATQMEAQLCKSDDVIVVGGGNSAGQAAVFLAGVARHVYIMVRRNSLEATMSRYLIRRIEEHQGITVLAQSEIVALHGDTALERVDRIDHPTRQVQSMAVSHVFLMMGADPNTDWVGGCVALDSKGFVLTGVDLTAELLRQAGWTQERHPYPFETSMPGVFAVGDVRSGNVKRVASAVGEGSIAVSYVHRVVHPV